MNRPWKIWVTFAVCAAVLLGVMAWVSVTVLRLDRAQARAQAQAELEEKVRLALWRMDSMLAPLMAQESARPSSAYTAFPAAERAYGKMYNALSSGEVLMPSPLLSQVSSNILLHFQLDTHGRLTSPQVPDGNQRDLAEAQFATHEQIETAAAHLRDLQRIMTRKAPTEIDRAVSPTLSSSKTQTSPSSWRNQDALFALTPPPSSGQTLAANGGTQSQVESAQLGQKSSLPQQMVRNDLEMAARGQSLQSAVGLNLKNTFASSNPPNGATFFGEALKPVWLQDTLLLVRRVPVQSQEVIQGCWVNWDATRRWLLDGIQDLLPSASLEPLKDNSPDTQGRVLASLPVRVVPGSALSSLDPLASPILLTLLLGWACVLLAGAAVALLLQGTLSLSERRAAFVSAVTHELRTPLTTFKMYSEMLANGMVPDETKRRGYLLQLCAEADRLHHLVENVLAYARLERASARGRVEKVSLQELIQRVRPRLIQRAEQAGMTIVEDADPRALASVVQVDVAAVEQILFNLVDNACKYAAPSSDPKSVHLEALPEQGKFALLRVRDHGQGISAEAAKRLFQPFCKSAHEAARTAPGVGLGLALCRRLSRSLGGELRLNSAFPGGACFELLLPVSRDTPAE